MDCNITASSFLSTAFQRLRTLPVGLLLSWDGCWDRCSVDHLRRNREWEQARQGREARSSTNSEVTGQKICIQAFMEQHPKTEACVFSVSGLVLCFLLDGTSDLDEAVLGLEQAALGIVCQLLWLSICNSLTFSTA